MKKKNTILLIMVISLILFFTGCTKDNNTQKTNELYLNLQSVKVEDLIVKLEEAETVYPNNTVIYLSFTNKNPKPIEIDLKDAKILREKDNAEYTPMFSFGGDYLRLECDKTTKIKLSLELPTKINEEKYKLTFLKNQYIIHLYDMPEEKKYSVSVNIYIDGKQIDTITKKVTDTINDYERISKDNLYIVNQWYKDSQCLNPITEKDHIPHDINIYGKQSDIFDIKYQDYVDENFIIGFINKPKQQYIKMPSKYNNINCTFISSNMFTNDNILKRIYIPETYDFIGENFNGCTNLEAIYYGGTEEQWNKSYQGKLTDNISIYFNQQENILDYN